jgi:hypothetical protein
MAPKVSWKKDSATFLLGSSWSDFGTTTISKTTVSIDRFRRDEGFYTYICNIDKNIQEAYDSNPNLRSSWKLFPWSPYLTEDLVLVSFCSIRDPNGLYTHN